MIEENQIQKETNEYFKKVDSEIGIDENDIYSNGKHSKVADFFIGFGISYGISAVIGTIYMGISFFTGFLSSTIMPNILSTFMGIGLFPMGIIAFVLPLILVLVFVNKKFPSRRLIKVGAWTAFLLPIIAFFILLGACFVAVSNSGW